MPASTRITVLGSGSWGTALAAHLARQDHQVLLWGRTAVQVEAMRSSAENARYLPGVPLPSNLNYTTDLASAVQAADLLLVVVPSHAFVEILHAVLPFHRAAVGIAWATKGFEPGSGRFLHEVVDEIFGPAVPKALITGPSFAREVATGLPSAVTVHADDATFALEVARLLHGPSFRAYTGQDLCGAELGGAMKNVLAVATGVCDGMQLGLNARAGLITRGLSEMLKLNACLGGRAETIMGLAGLGDLVLTCTGDLSRNRRLGMALGQGKKLADAVAQIGQAVESIQTVDEVMRLARRHALDLPICEHVQRVLHEDITPAEGLKSLLARELKAEFPEDQTLV
jgi:glycerol-3-phosphate dehydrogenase (NAD(P)+)